MVENGGTTVHGNLWQSTGSNMNDAMHMKVLT